MGWLTCERDEARERGSSRTCSLGASSKLPFGPRPLAVPLVLAVWTASVASAQERYVRPASDCPVAGDGTAHACAPSAGGAGAFNDLVAAGRALGPGEVLYLDGTFDLGTRPLFMRARGEPGRPIRITSRDHDRPAMVRADTGAAVAYFLVDHAEIDHLDIVNSHEDGGGVLLGENSATATHVDAQFHHNRIVGASNGISVVVLHDSNVYDNVFEEVGSRANGLGHCLYTGQGNTNVAFFRNRCVAKPDVDSAHCFHIYHSEAPGPARDTTYHDNVCIGFTVGAGIYSGSTNTRIVSNTFVGAGRETDIAGFRCALSQGGTGLFANNIVVGSGFAGSVRPSVCEVEVHHNLYHSLAGTLRFKLEERAVEWTHWSRMFDRDSVWLADPRLADPASADVRLGPSSAAIDRGDTALGVGPVDAYGNDRLSGPALDVGAAEWSAPARDGGLLDAGSDGGSWLDGGSLDGGSLDGASRGRDAAAIGAMPSTGGCGCGVAAPVSSPWWALVLVWTVVRRRAAAPMERRNERSPLRAARLHRAA